MSGALDMVKTMKTMKTLPTVAVRLTRMISDDRYSLDQFEEVIRMDPTLVLRLLKMVNSPFYALSSEVESIAEAVAFVGMDDLRNCIVMDIMKNVIREKPSRTAFSRNRLWLHSAAVAITSRILCERIFEMNGENAFLAGLIHDVGIIVEDQVVPEQFELICVNAQEDKKCITVHEQQVMGTDHAEVGYWVAKDWQLPEPVQEGIRWHHDASGGTDPKSMAGVLKISGYLASRLDYALFPWRKMDLEPDLLLHIRDHIREYKAVAMDLPREINKAKDILGLEMA